MSRKRQHEEDDYDRPDSPELRIPQGSFMLGELGGSRMVWNIISPKLSSLSTLSFYEQVHISSYSFQPLLPVPVPLGGSDTFVFGGLPLPATQLPSLGFDLNFVSPRPPPATQNRNLGFGLDLPASPRPARLSASTLHSSLAPVCVS